MFADYKKLADAAEVAITKLKSGGAYADSLKLFDILKSIYDKNKDYMIPDPGFAKFEPGSIYEWAVNNHSACAQNRATLLNDTEGDVSRKMDSNAPLTKTLTETSLADYTPANDLTRTLLSILLQGIRHDSPHPSFHYSVDMKPEASLNESANDIINLMDTATVTFKDNKVIHYHVLRSLFMLIAAMGDNYVNNIDDMFGYTSWLDRNKKCYDALESRITYIQGAAEPKFLQKKFSYNMTYAPMKGLHSILNLLNFEVFLKQPYEAAMLCSGPSGSGKTANTFGIPGQMAGVIDILKGKPDGQFFAYDFYSCCFNFIESFREATENAVIISHKLKRGDRGGNILDTYVKHANMEFLNSPGVGEVDIDFANIKIEIDKARLNDKLKFIANT